MPSIQVHAAPCVCLEVQHSTHCSSSWPQLALPVADADLPGAAATVLQVVEELLGKPEGNELYLLPPEQLGLAPGQPLRCADVAEGARLQRCTALGLVYAGGDLLCLAPAADSAVLLMAGDKVVVLAEEGA
jgi:hypothetical protein